MKNFTKNPNSRPLLQPQWKTPGFALVATLTMMILLAILAVGLLSLSAVSLRSAGHGSAQAEARANARMALMVAIGELQNQMGPDQRISANADIMSMNSAGTPVTVPNPNWTGVWDSWVAGALADAPVGANYPSAPSHHQTLGAQSDITMRPNYSNKDRHFRAWLLSLTPEEATNMFAPMGPMLEGESLPGEGDEAVLLVGEGSVGPASSSSFISARLIPVKESASSDTRGRYAWWVGDESQKARLINDSYYGQTLTSAEKILRSQAPASTGTTTLAGLESITPLEETRLDALPSRKTLDIVPGVEEVVQSGNTYTASQKNFHYATPFSYTVLADVREGGLKRDLNTLLERDIDPAEVYNFSFVEEFKRATGYTQPTAGNPGGEAFMLYNFDSMLQSVSPTGMANVPIQDLAAYYQLYDNNRTAILEGEPVLADNQPMKIGGLQYSSTQSSPANSLLSDGIMISGPNFGTTRTDYDRYLRQYTAQYRRPAPVKFELILHYVTQERDPAVIDAEITAKVNAALAEDPPRILSRADAAKEVDTHELKIGVTPSMTFWNPYNVSLVMHDKNTFPGTAQQKGDQSSMTWVEDAMPLNIKFKKSKTYSGTPTKEVVKRMRDVYDSGYQPYFYTNGNVPLIFEPGETKVVALQATSLTDPSSGDPAVDFMNRGGGGRKDNEHFVPELGLVPGWNPEKFVRTSDNRSGGLDARSVNPILTFRSTDYISAEITSYNDSGAFGISAISTIRQHRPTAFAIPKYHFKLFNWIPRMSASATYVNNFVNMGFPRVGRGGIVNTSSRPIKVPARRADQLIAAMGDPVNLTDDLPQSFFYYSRKAATETHESSNMSPPGGGSGRRFPARPFLHSPFAQSTFFDNIDGASLYNFGWNWFFMPLDNMLDTPISISTDDFGYAGGGYTAESGTTHVVQQQLPLTPPISIAGLSHAILGGHSIATEATHYMGTWPFPDHRNMTVEGYRRATATGYGGLTPKGSQAIGNSYAHPNIPSRKAFTTVNRMYVEGSNTVTPFADHSYLANKALWDDFFFSSITPIPDNPIFNSTPKTAKEVATEFFFNGQPLLNRRIQPYMPGLNQAEFDNLFGQAALFQDGLADKIAAHLLVEGAFNINSTSVEAWKAMFSSLKGKPVAYYDKDTSLTTGGTNLTEVQPVGVPIGQGSLPNAAPYQGSPSDTADPDQWLGWRELTDTEIDELSVAIVKQVKMRGPFLSLSEFVNRRLDATNPTLSVKGALQAALDDANVSINEGFRTKNRKFTRQEISFVNAAFPEAMEGAIAYGSSAYVDQADLLRNMAEQLTPRGDTFVIRTYGDSLDADGNVLARAWCEAVVQRTPEYVDSADAPHLKQVDLTSESNKNFGRKFNIVLFRWLNSSEI